MGLSMFKYIDDCTYLALLKLEGATWLVLANVLWKEVICFIPGWGKEQTMHAFLSFPEMANLEETSYWEVEPQVQSHQCLWVNTQRMVILESHSYMQIFGEKQTFVVLCN